jgi:hypothetical protein
MNGIFCFNIPYAANTADEDTDEVYDDVGKFAINEPVPFDIIFVTIEIDADIAFTSVCVADDAEMYCGVDVTLILFTVFRTSVGKEPVPFSNILITLLKLEVILLANDLDTATDDEY